MMVKRLFDVVFSIIFLLLFFWLLLLIWIVAILDTKTWGIFTQQRIGYQGKIFVIYKIRTIQISSVPGKKNISLAGQFFRRYKLDELPQLFNILQGDMSVVGFRPDVPGYYNLLTGENSKILEMKPGLTSLASLTFRKEEYLLLRKDNPKKFNDEVIFPEKVRLNLDYYYNHTFFGDLKIIWNTIF
jgi:lipopolysaccharide/colanic/teichoic acid biosynthesis glycosyltransferase